MTDEAHLVLEREASEARARLMATLDVLELRTRSVARDAARGARSTALGFAGALALGLTFAIAEHTQARADRPRRSRPPERSLLGDALRAGAVAFVFVSVSAWSKHAPQPTATGRANQPQARRIAALVSALLGQGPRARALRAGTTHALLAVGPYGADAGQSPAREGPP
jgi:hypothetical protein